MRTEIQIKLDMARNVRKLLIDSLLLPGLTDKARATIQDGIDTADRFIAAHYVIDDLTRDFGGLNK